jgi:YggT family protein
MITEVILFLVNKLLYVYILLIGIRIVFSWFKPSLDVKSHKGGNKVWHNLCLITGPYLALFRGVKSMRSRGFDYTPIAAVFVLLVASQVIRLFDIARHITLVNIFIIFILGVWEALFAILSFLLILCVVRLIGIFFREGPFGRFLDVIDLALQPFVSFILRLTRNGLNYQNILILCIGFLVTVCIAGSFSFQTLYRHLSLF